MESVPNITTVDTATAVLWASQRTTGSAPSTAAAPQMALPVEVIKAVWLSTLSNFPINIPKANVPATIIKSAVMAGNPMASTCWKVSLKP